MKETVDRILKEEGSARTRIENAQSRADDIILKAREEAKSITEGIVKDCVNQAVQKRETREEELLAEKEKLLKEAREAAALSRERIELELPKIAEEIFLDIITIKD